MTPARIVVTCCALVLLCSTFPARASSADEQEIRRIDSELVATLNAREIDKWLSYFADDGEMWPPSAPCVVGKDAIRKMIEGYAATPTFAVAHHLESVVVAQSGDLAYVTYTYEMGNPVAERGKDVSIYRKEPDGSWKLIIDMWSPD